MNENKKIVLLAFGKKKMYQNGFYALRLTIFFSCQKSLSFNIRR